jgi:hypothetical protein
MVYLYESKTAISRANAKLKKFILGKRGNMLVRKTHYSMIMCALMPRITRFSPGDTQQANACIFMLKNNLTNYSATSGQVVQLKLN